MEKKREDNKTIVSSASAINFKSEAYKKSKEKAAEKKKDIAQLYRIDHRKLNINISI